MGTNEIYTEKITRGKRTYFFEVMRSSTGDPYLRISESTLGRTGFDHHRLMIFPEDVKQFVSAVGRLQARMAACGKRDKKNPGKLPGHDALV